MKTFSRDFTRTEMILIVVLALVLVGLGYYQFVDQPVRQAITNAQSEQSSLQTELDAVQARLAHLQGIRNSLDALADADNMTWMGSYNNSREEVAFLDAILSSTLNYTVSFANVTRNGDQIRRSFTLQYTTPDYESAADIIEKLCTGRNRCLVGDVKCAINKDGHVTVNQSATFYETMVGGTPDAALPADSAAANS